MLSDIQQQRYKASQIIHNPEKQKELWRKAYDAFENMHFMSQLVGKTISWDAYKMYLRNYYSDPEVVRMAEQMWKEFKTPHNARDAGQLASIAGTGLFGATIAEIARKAEEQYKSNPSKYNKVDSGYDRRTVLKGLLLLPLIGVSALEYACGGGGNGGSPIPGPGPGPSPTYVSFQVPVEGLLRQTRLNGELRIPGKPLVIPIVNGVMAVEPKHELVAGQTYRDAEFRTNEGVARITPVKVTNSNILIPVGYTEVPLDAVDDQRIFDMWANTRRQGGANRWDKYLNSFRIFMYDRSKFAEPPNSSTILVEEGTYRPPQTAINVVEDIVNTYIGPFTANIHPNGGIIRESQSSERPKLTDEGWLIYMFGDEVYVGPTPASISRGDNGPLNRGEITRASMLIRANQAFRFNVAIDTHESVFGSSNRSFPIVLGGSTPTDPVRDRPLEEILAVSQIQYMRRLLNHTSNGVLDYQSM